MIVAETHSSDRVEPEKQAASVLHVLDHSWPVLSGYAVRSRNLISAQQRLGESLRVLTGPLHQLDDPVSAELVLDGVSYIRTPIKGQLARVALQRRWPVVRERAVVVLLRDRILEVIDSHPVRIVYAHSPALCGLAALQAARKRKLPFVYEIRAFWEDAAADQKGRNVSLLRSRLTRELETFVVQRADAVAAIAWPLLADLEARGIPSDKLFHVPNAVDVERFVPKHGSVDLRREFGLGSDPIFVFFGSLYRYEGISWLIHAAAELRRRGKKFEILIIGRGEDQSAILNAVSECGAKAYVHMIDHVPHDQISRYYSVADVAVYPRRSIRLTELVTPLKPLEAMALKIPVLASRVGGICELVEHERTGLLFEPESIAEFCSQAERLISSPSLCESLAENGREFVLRERNWNTVAQRYQRIYEFVLSSKRDSHARA
jgi:PEP-CTERM/exosortase A-associated glycosyltransferase